MQRAVITYNCTLCWADRIFIWYFNKLQRRFSNHLILKILFPVETLYTDGTAPGSLGGNLLQMVTLLKCLDLIWGLPSWEERGSTCGSLGRNRHRREACHHSRWCRRECRSCTRYTARDTSSRWAACSRWTGDRSGDLIRQELHSLSDGYNSLTWSPAFSTSNQLLGRPGLLVVVGVSEAEVTVVWGLGWRLEPNHSLHTWIVSL